MGLLSIFSKPANKSSESVADVRGGFMGKIPARPDFVRHQAGSNDLKVMDQWVHEGIAYLARRFPSDWKERLNAFGRINVYIGSEGANPGICGVLQPSNDKSGRQHPFIDFVTSTNASLTTLPYIGYRYADFLKKGGMLKDESGGDMDVDKLILQSNAQALSILAYDEHALAQQLGQNWAGKTSADFWENILPAASTVSRLNFARDVLQTLKMAANRGPERIAWGVRLPIPAGVASEAVVAFWLSLICRVLGNQKWRPHIFWNPQHSGAKALTIYFRSPNASSFAQLICPEVDEGGVVDVLRRPLENLPEITSTQLKSLVDTPAMTWQDMLQNWLKG
jgi:type VI secretion system protein ImpM